MFLNGIIRWHIHFSVFVSGSITFPEKITIPVDPDVL